MRYENTNIGRQNPTPNTHTVLSMKTKFYTIPVGETQPVLLGMADSVERSQSRSIKALRGVGYGDKIAELVPQYSEAPSLTVNRAALYLQTIQQALGYSAHSSGLVRALNHHKWPFDVIEEVILSELAQEKMEGLNSDNLITSRDELAQAFSAVQTVYETAWLNNWSSSSSSNTAEVMERVSITVTDMTDGSGYKKYLALVRGEESDGNNPFEDDRGAANLK